MASNLGIDANSFLGAIEGGSQDRGYAHIKGKAIMAGEFASAFTVEGAVKDTALVAQAMIERKTNSALMQALNEGYREVAASGRSKRI